MAAIGRRRAVMQQGRFRSAGAFAWLMWLLVHIYFLSGFKNRLFVLIQWGWSYLTFARGSRLIVNGQWRSYGEAMHAPEAHELTPPYPTSRRGLATAMMTRVTGEPLSARLREVFGAPGTVRMGRNAAP